MTWCGHDRIGTRYREWSQAGPVRLRWVARLLDELEPGSVVADPGCGPGKPATRLLAAAPRGRGRRLPRAWLRPGGVLLTSAPLVAGDRSEPDWLGAPMFFGGIGAGATRRAAAMFLRGPDRAARYS